MFSQLFKVMGLSKTWPEYTMEEVKEHNSASSLWIVAGNSVYDVTSLLGKHVGGDAALLKRGGATKDCTQDFLFHGRAARRDVENYKIGELVLSPSNGTASRRPPNSSSTLASATTEPPSRALKEGTPSPAGPGFVPPQTTVTLSPSLSTENMTSLSWRQSKPGSSICETCGASANGLSGVDSPMESSFHQLVEVAPS